jgi:hypothetical protein
MLTLKLPSTAICPERDRLLRTASDARHKEAELVGLADEIAGTVNPETFQRCAVRIMKASHAANMAWDAYRKHLKIHACGVGE